MNKPELEQGIMIQPIKDLIHKGFAGKPLKDGHPWTVAMASRLKSTVVGTQWPQQRKKDAGLVQTGQCIACDMQEAGTLLHRHCRCRASQAARQCLPNRMLQNMQHANASSPWWTRALAPHPGQWIKKPATSVTWRGSTSFSNNIYT